MHEEDFKNVGIVLILAPTGRDASLAHEALCQAGINSDIVPDIEALCARMDADASAVLIASEALSTTALERLLQELLKQPPWSDMPLIVLTGGLGGLSDSSRATATLDRIGNMTLLERPLRVSTLTHAVRAGMGARKRQFEVRDHLEKHIQLEQQLQIEHTKQRVFLRDVLASVTGGRLRLCDSPDDLPPHLKEVSPPIPVSTITGLSELRSATKQAAVSLGFEKERWQDLLTAVGEASMNAAVHAGGGVGIVCAEGNTVQVWVEDRGRGIEVEDLPRATLSKGYTTIGSFGHGMKMMLESTDRVWLLTGPAGTTVVLEQDCESSPPNWY